MNNDEILETVVFNELVPCLASGVLISSPSDKDLSEVVTSYHRNLTDALKKKMNDGQIDDHASAALKFLPKLLSKHQEIPSASAIASDVDMAWRLGKTMLEHFSQHHAL